MLDVNIVKLIYFAILKYKVSVCESWNLWFLRWVHLTVRLTQVEEYPMYFPLTVVSESASITGIRGEKPGAISKVLLFHNVEGRVI